MESVGALVHTKREIGLGKSGRAGDHKCFCNIDECIVKDSSCSSYSPVLEYSFGSALWQFSLGSYPQGLWQGQQEHTGSCDALQFSHF